MDVRVVLFCGGPGSEGYPPSNLSEFFDWLKAMRAKVPIEHEATAEFEIDQTLEYGDSYIEVMLSYWRPATAEEEAENKRRVAAVEALNEQQDRLQLERLKAKYESPPLNIRVTEGPKT